MNFFKTFLPFMDEIFNSMMPLFQWEALFQYGLPVLGGLLGGISGAQQGEPQTQTQTVRYLPPAYTSQQQALNNLMYYGAMQNLMAQQPQYQNLLNQYIYGTPAAGTQAAPTSKAGQIISEYQTQRAQAAETGKETKALETDLRVQTLKPLYQYINENTKAGTYDYTKGIREAGKAKQQLMDLTGMSADEATGWVFGIFGKAQADATGKEYDIPALKDPKFKDFQNVYKAVTTTPTGEVPTTPTGEVPTTPTGEVPAGGVLGGILGSPQYLAEQFRLARESGMENIENWYERAAREMEQRGISQYGGLIGSPYERDVGAILGQRGKMETELGRQLSEAEISATQQNWYNMLNALTGLQQMQSSLQAQQITPWLGAAQQMTNVPWGQTTTATTSGAQGPGIIPGAIGGVYAGAGLANYLSNWGQGTTQPTNIYGAGGTTNLGLSGTQNLWNQYAGSNLWR